MTEIILNLYLSLVSNISLLIGNFSVPTLISQKKKKIHAVPYYLDRLEALYFRLFIPNLALIIQLYEGGGGGGGHFDQVMNFQLDHRSSIHN